MLMKSNALAEGLLGFALNDPRLGQHFKDEADVTQAIKNYKDWIDAGSKYGILFGFLPGIPCGLNPHIIAMLRTNTQYGNADDFDDF
jgi:hypothetical protein